MAGSVNKVIIVGALGREPEVRRMSNGDPVVNLSVATSESWKDRNTGERQEKTEWHRVTIFNSNLAKVAENYLHKGSRIYLEGALSTRKYTDKDGIEKFTTEIVLNKFRGELVLLDSRNSGEPAHSKARNNNPAPQDNAFGRGGLDDSDIPF